MEFSRRNILRMGIISAADLSLKAIPAFAEKPLETLVHDELANCSAEAPAEENVIKFELITGSDSQTDQHPLFDSSDPNVEQANYFASNETKDARGQLHEGRFTTLISAITDRDIVSRSHRDCEGTLLLGRDKNPPHKTIGFYAHIDPLTFIIDHKEAYAKKFAARLQELYSRIKPGSASFAFLGGQYGVHAHDRFYSQLLFQTKASEMEVEGSFSEHYIRSILLLRHIVQEQFKGLEPQILLGPKSGPGDLHIRVKMRDRKIIALLPETGKPIEKPSICSLPEYLRANLRVAQKTVKR